MDVLALLIALVALLVALLAYSRTGGIHDLRGRVDALSSATEATRDKAADAVARLERLIRGTEKPTAERKEDEGPPPPPA